MAFVFFNFWYKSPFGEFIGCEKAKKTNAFSTFLLPGRGRGRDGGCFGWGPEAKKPMKTNVFLLVFSKTIGFIKDFQGFRTTGPINQ